MSHESKIARTRAARVRFPGRPRIDAFDGGHDYASSRRWFAAYLAEQPGGRFAEEALHPDDSVCVLGCWKGTPGPPAKAAYAACKQRSCAEPCGVKACTGKSFGYQDGLGVAGDDACGACRKKHCCSTLAECAEDFECSQATECYASCPDQSCGLSKCNSAQYLPLLVELAPDWACRSRYCQVDCGQAANCSVAFAFGEAYQSCVQDKCCAETKACSDDVECLVHSICIINCGKDEACKTACDSKHWIGGGLDSVMRYCLTRSCPGTWLATAATSTCGGFGGMTPSCQTCMDQNCCTQGEACGTNAACAGIHLCIKACGADTVCRDKCLSTGAPAGATLHQSLSTCQQTNCSAACGA